MYLLLFPVTQLHIVVRFLISVIYRVYT